MLRLRAESTAIVTPAPLKPRKGPVIRLAAEVSNDTTLKPQRSISAVVEPKRKRSSIFGPVPDDDPEEHQRRS